MKKTLSYIFFILILYFWIFSPTFGLFREQLRVTNIITLMGVIFCVTKPRLFIDFLLKYQKEFLWLLYFTIISILLLLLDPQTQNIKQHFLLITNAFCVIPMLMNYAKRNGFGTESDYIRSLLIVSTIAAIISIICLLSPPINNYIKYSLIRYDEESFLYGTDYRGFGFASSLTGNYSFVLGFLTALGCFYLTGNRWYIPFIPIILLAALINARTGILIGIAGMSTLILKRQNSFVPTLIAFVLVVILLTHLDYFLILLGANSSTIDWITSFKNQILILLTTQNVDNATTTNILFNDMWVLPDDATQWLWGRGYDVFNDEFRNSDIGWLNQLNYGGLLYFIPLLIFFVKIVKHFINNKSFSFGMLIMLAIIISNTKGRLFPDYSLFFIIMFLYFITSQNRTFSQTDSEQIG